MSIDEGTADGDALHYGRLSNTGAALGWSRFESCLPQFTTYIHDKSY